MATKKLTRAQQLQRLEIARKFTADEQKELMLKKAAKDPAYMASLGPSQRLALAHYQKHKQIAEEVEREQGEGR
jgi:hypothetical protein